MISYFITYLPINLEKKSFKRNLFESKKKKKHCHFIPREEIKKKCIFKKQTYFDKEKNVSLDCDVTVNLFSCVPSYIFLGIKFKESW